MMRHKKLMLAAALMSAAAFVPYAGTVSAGHPYDPNVDRIANPANVCKSIPGSIEHGAEMFGAPTPDLSWFDYDECVTMMARGEAFVEPAEEFGDPYAQCDFLQTLGVVYPYTFHDTDSLEDILLPNLIAKNRKQCGSALFAFHSIFTALLPLLPEGPPPG